ncbi:MAG: hypothetical protein AAGE52_11520 [Myxococcota bacterium]
MGMGANFAIATAESVGRTLGARAGLSALRKLVDSLESPEDQARALFSALAYAHQLRDTDATVWLLVHWSTLDGVRGFTRIVRVCEQLVAEDRWEDAHSVAAAECTRTVDVGRAFYLRARCTRDPRSSVEDLRRALRLAQREPKDEALVLAATARLARVTLEKPKPAPDLAALSPCDRLVVVAARLHAKGRYGRVSALDGILELAASGDEEVAEAAIRLAARHVDMEGRLTDIEMDRVRAAIARWPDEDERASALAHLTVREAIARGSELDDPQLAKTLRQGQRVLDHNDPGSPPPEGLTAAWRALDVIAAFRRGEEDVADRLQALIAILDGSRPAIEVPLLTAAALGCESGNPAAKAAAERVAARLLDLPGPRPARGWLRLGRAVADPSLGEELRRIAVDVHEPGAAEDIAQRSVRDAWQAYQDGDREKALAMLRESRRLSER